MARRRSRGGRSARSSRGGGNAAWLLALVLVLGGVAAAGAFVVRSLTGREATDAATLCPEDGPAGVMAVLLDLTDPLAPAQAERLEAILAREVAEAPMGTMVSLGVVSAEPSEWGARFARCKPATGEDASLLTENPALIAETFEAEFAAPMEAAVAEMMAAGEQDASPIMESLQALLSATPGALDVGPRLTMVLVSDLIQHSDLLSFYRGEGWEAFEAAGGPERLSRNLEGAEVLLIRVPRPGAAEAGALVDGFWSRYLDRQGAAAPLREIVLGDL